MAKLVKTTIRIDAELKKAAEREAIEKNITLQVVVNTALEENLKNRSHKTDSVSDKEFSDLLKKVNQEYGSALRKLAKL